jgi:hypothetical protein
MRWSRKEMVGFALLIVIVIGYVIWWRPPGLLPW